jgi:acetyl-CoA C-acetyltransferase
VEAWTVPFDRDGKPEKAFVAVRTPDGGRALALIDDADAAAVTVGEDIAGAKVRVGADGQAEVVSAG